jgi:tRNA(fMet)-specific endonuclease VapC
VILDTNALSAIVDGRPEIRRVIEGAPDMAIPVIALGEYRFGVALSNRNALYRQWLLDHLREYRMLAITEETTRRYADVRVELKRDGKPIPSNDIWIAALSREHRMPILSQDRHFDAVAGLQRLTW